MRVQNTAVTVDQRKRAFLTAFASLGNILKACEAAGIHRTTYYEWVAADPSFVARCAIAKESYGDLLEAKLANLALQQDNVRALEIALKMSGRFVEHGRVEHTHSGPTHGSPLQIEVVYTSSAETYDLPALAPPSAEEDQD